MNRSISIRSRLILAVSLIAFAVHSQSSFEWKYLDVRTIEEPLKNLYDDLEIRHFNLNGNCGTNDGFPNAYYIFETSGDDFEVYFFNGNPGMGIPSELYIKNITGGHTFCFFQEDLGLQSICDVDVDYIGNKIILADCASGKIVYINTDGSMQNEIDVPFDFVHVKFADNKFFFHVLDYDENNSADLIKIYSTQMDLLKEYRFPSSNRVIRGFSKSGSLQSDQNTVFFNPTYDANIYQLNEIEKKVTFSLSDFVVNDNYKKDPYMNYFVRNNILYFTQNLFNRSYSFIVDLNSKEVFAIHNSIPILANKLGFEYYYVFSAVSYSNSNGFATYIGKNNARKAHDLVGHHHTQVDLSDAVSNIKKLGFYDNDHNFMLYDYNFDFLRRNATNSLSSVFPVADKVNLDCTDFNFKTVYNSDNTITLEIISETDTEIEVGLFSLLERVSLNKINVAGGVKKYHTIEVPSTQKNIGFVHLRNSVGCRSTKQVFIY